MICADKGRVAVEHEPGYHTFSIKINHFKAVFTPLFFISSLRLLSVLSLISFVFTPGRRRRRRWGQRRCRCLWSEFPALCPLQANQFKSTVLPQSVVVLPSFFLFSLIPYPFSEIDFSMRCRRVFVTCGCCFLPGAEETLLRRDLSAGEGRPDITAATNPKGRQANLRCPRRRGEEMPWRLCPSRGGQRQRDIRTLLQIQLGGQHL